METDISSVPLSELSTNPRLTPVEAVTIVRELALRVKRGTLPGVPSPHVIRVASAGTITVEGPVAADARTVAHAAHLLDTLLPGFDVPADVRVPGALRLIVARALGTLDLPVYGSLEKFTEALSRFAAEDPEDCIRELVLRRVPLSEVESVPAAAVNASPAPVDDDITISDIRRARRATGLTLAEISERTGIPAPLLCELEWGYLQHWPSSHVARRLMVSYARAAGLDDELVVRTAWPLLEESIRARGSAVDSHGPILDGVVVDASSEIALPTERTTSLVTTHPAVSAQRARRRSAIVAALMIPALLLIGLSLGVRDDMPVRGIPSNVPMPAPAPRQQPPAAADAASGRAPATLPHEGEGDVRLVGMPDDPAYSPTFASGGMRWHRPVWYCVSATLAPPAIAARIRRDT